MFYKHSAIARGVRVNAPSVVTGSIARSQNDGLISSVRLGAILTTENFTNFLTKLPNINASRGAALNSTQTMCIP